MPGGEFGERELRRKKMGIKGAMLGSACVAALLIVVGGGIPALAQGNVAPASAAQRDIAKEERNRAFVINFYDLVFNKHDFKAAEDMVSEGYIQHNPRFPTGRAAFIEILAKQFKQNPEAHSRIVRSAVDVDLVWLHIHSVAQPQDRGMAIINIFRVADGKIVEHWDVVQPVPEKSDNDNTMF
jgi:predicted SnoaL-like aldol condensation-catalyzing enzyme